MLNDLKVKEILCAKLQDSTGIQTCQTHEADSIIFKFLKLTNQMLGVPSEKWITVLNTRQNESVDEGYESRMSEILTDRTDDAELEIVNRTYAAGKEGLNQEWHLSSGQR